MQTVYKKKEGKLACIVNTFDFAEALKFLFRFVIDDYKM